MNYELRYSQIQPLNALMENRWSGSLGKYTLLLYLLHTGFRFGSCGYFGAFFIPLAYQLSNVEYHDFLIPVVQNGNLYFTS